jgi:hypothetical protein
VVVVDGWNVTAKEMGFPSKRGARIAANDNSRVLRPQARN